MLCAREVNLVPLDVCAELHTLLATQVLGQTGAVYFSHNFDPTSQPPKQNSRS